MSKAEATVQELVDMIERGQLRLPEMQRRYVWRAPRVRDLLDSLYRGYPSGAILVWDTDEEVPLQAFSVAQGENKFAQTQLLLDGQQRLTSLSAVLRGEPVTVRGRTRPIEILFNLEHPDHIRFANEVNEDVDDDEPDDDAVEDDETGTDGDAETTDSNVDELQQRFNEMTFVVATRKLASLPHWVSVSDVLKSDSDRDFLRRAGVTDLDDERAEKYQKRLARLRSIKKYVYRMDILERSLSYVEVTDIFVRVNSLGAKLRGSDLALAQITAKWRGSLELFVAYQNSCAKTGYELDLGTHLRALIAIATGQSKFQSVGTLSTSDLQGSWEKTKRAMDFAISFLKENCGIDSPALLSSPSLIIALAYYGLTNSYAIPSSERPLLRKWVLLANAKGRFTRGSSETLLDQDLAAIKRGDTAAALMERLAIQVGRLEIVPEELKGRNQVSSIFKTMFLAFKARGAQDWETGLEISIGHRGHQDKLQFHHIFPKAVLRNRYSQSEIYDIANLAFIGGRTNRTISAKPPEKYIPEIVATRGAKNFEDQGIPTAPELLSIEAYEQFLSERRIAIANALNEYLK